MAHCQLPSSHAADVRTGAYRDPRVSYFLQPGDKLVQCAYDVDHWILATKITNHLVKCRHNYLNAVKNGTKKVDENTKMVICTYNSAHHMPHSKLKDHVDNHCESNPFRTGFFEMMDAEKVRRDAIAAEEKRQADEKANPWTKGDPGAGPYGDAQNSSAGFWGKEKEQKPQGDQQRGGFQKMDTDEQKEQKPRVDTGIEAGGAVGGVPPPESENIKQEGKVDVKKEAGISEGSNASGSRSSPRIGGAIGGISPAVAALLKAKKEEEAAEREKEHEMEGRFVRPGQFGAITTTFPIYKERAKKKGERPEEVDERGLTAKERKDPNRNWELVVPNLNLEGNTSRFLSYDPRKTVKMNEEQGKMFIQNPQGLTKSEKKEWRARQAELHLIEKPDEEEIGNSTTTGRAGVCTAANSRRGSSTFITDEDAARAARMKLLEEERKLDLDDKEPPPIVGRQIRTRRGKAGPACPGFELELDMQQNPVEEYEKWGGSSRGDSCNTVIVNGKKNPLESESEAD